MTTLTHPRRARDWAALAAIGVIGGLLSGAFGVGGGIVMVPLLLTLTSMDQRQAAMVSLVAIIPTSITGMVTYAAVGRVDVVVGLVVSAGAILGAIVGSRLLRRMSLGWLRWMFIVLLVLVAARMVFLVPARAAAIELDWGVTLGLLALGIVMGVAAGLFGIGGGVLAVPALIALFGMGDLVAKGTSLLIMIPTAIASTLTNLRGGTVDITGGLVVGAAAAAAAVGGAALAFLMSPQLSSILFATLLVIAAIQLAIKALRARRSANGDVPTS